MNYPKASSANNPANIRPDYFVVPQFNGKIKVDNKNNHHSDSAIFISIGASGTGRTSQFRSLMEKNMMRMHTPVDGCFEIVPLTENVKFSTYFKNKF